jgi:cytidyltransferase-like protein
MALPKLRDHFNKTHRDAFNKMLEQKVHVVEKLAASSFDVQRGDMTNLYFKSGQQEPMDIVDRTIVKFYESAIRHLQGLSDSVKEEMPKDWRFGFDYLIDGETPNFKYSMLPKNNLVLTHIKVLNPSTGKIQKVIRDTQVLNKWSEKLEVQQPPVVFEGVLRHDQKEALIKILEMTDSQFAKNYQDKSFTRDIFSVFNPSLRKSALQESLDGEIDSLVVSFVDGKIMNSFKLESFNKVNEDTEDRKPSDIYQITIVDVIEKLSNYDFKQHKLTEEKKDRRYIELMSEVFNNYIKENAAKYIGVDFDIAEFAKKDVFRLNKSFIKNQNTLKLVENNILAELFKILISSFRHERKKTTDILSEDMVNQMNEIVKNIKDHIDGNVSKNEVLDFNSYLQKGKINDKPEIELNEALKVKTVKHGKKMVNMFVGRFQPFTLGHAKVIKQLHNQNGHPTVIFLVKAKKAKKEDAFKRPYDEQTQLDMLNNLKKELPIEHVFIVPSAAIDVMFNEMRPKYEPVLWGTGTDRMKQYGFQVDKPEYREDLNVLPEFGLYEIQRGDENISATKVRNAMLDDDFKAFKSMTPKGIHGMYNDLKSKLEQSMVANESNDTILTFEQFISNI